MRDLSRGETGRIAAWFRAYPSVRLPVVAVAVVLVVVVVTAAAVPPVQGWARSWWGATTLALLMLVGYGTAVGVLGAGPSVGTRSGRGRWLPSVVAMAPIPAVLLVGDPVRDGTLAAGAAAWGAMVLGLLVLGATSTRGVAWPVRAAALGTPSWLLAGVGGLYWAASGSPQAVSGWLLPVQLCVVIAGVVVVPAILVVESMDALGGEGLDRTLARTRDDGTRLGSAGGQGGGHGGTGARPGGPGSRAGRLDAVGDRRPGGDPATGP